jgi:hypothetical protein
LRKFKKYYDLLGIPETASENDVRKAYRRMAMQFHPDKNPSPHANERFIQLTEAYEIILGKRDLLVEKSIEKSYEERMREARLRYYEHQKKEQLENEYYYQSLFTGKKWRFIKSTSVVGVLLFILLFLDIFLPKHIEKDTLAFYSKDVYGGTIDETVSLVISEKGKEYWISKLDYQLFGEYPEIVIERSWIFHQPVHFYSVTKTHLNPYELNYTFYSFKILLMVFFLIPLAVRLFKRRTIYYTVLYHLGLYFSPVATLLFLVNNDHWAHLLTLGFL